MIVTVSAAAQAEPFGRGGFGVRVGPRASIGIGIARPFYDPFWGPYYPYGVYPGVYPYVGQNLIGKVRVEGVPKQTDVFVDGYFAGTPLKVIAGLAGAGERHPASRHTRQG